MYSYWNKCNLSLSLGRANLEFFSVMSWAEGLSLGRPFQVLVTRWSYLEGLSTGGSFAEFKSPSENLAYVQKDCT